MIFFFFFYHPVHLSWDKSGCFKDKPLVASLYTDCNSIKKTHCQRVTNKINFETERITLWPTQFPLHLIHKGMVRGCWQNPALIPPPPPLLLTSCSSIVISSLITRCTAPYPTSFCLATMNWVQRNFSAKWYFGSANTMTILRVD